MGAASEIPQPSLAYRWIKANIYGALVNAVASFAIFKLGKALAVSDADTSTVTTTIFVVAGGIITAFGLAVLARLTGGVLRRKLPLFPLRSWVELHAYLGFAFGLAVSLAVTIPEETDPEPLGTDAAVFIAVASAIVGAIVGAVVGSLQAFVLHKAAHGVKTWIGRSALGGATLGLAVLAVSLGPQSVFASDVAADVAGFIVTVMVAIILLPALRRLQPRDAHPPAPDVRPSP